ncbi:hypothetical protein KSP39_PZI020820 [Platanthera zijinensis]|uniref:MULE transposase domain-containing protein n=1 Tax=Platanthera zijinensis TaxID=2320716 RepID=A0AAP0FWX0_9ASPA
MFSNVFLLDCTYKTNRYKMPLLSIVGMTSTQQSFFSAFVFLSNETEDSYKWALEHFKTILHQNSLPLVLVTDRELALLNVIKVVFPTSKHILCQVHIHRNVLANCKKYFKEGKECEKFLGVWQRLVEARTENEFYMRYNAIISSYSGYYPKVVAYVSGTWVEPYKEFFVSAWIDKYLHLGNSTTNRVEGGHNHLKKFLEVSIGTLNTVWRAFDQMITLQHTEIRRAFGHSSIQMSTEYKSILYSALVGRVSINALSLIREEEKKYSSKEYPREEDCVHTTRNTLGLPCAHEVGIYNISLKTRHIRYG